MISLILLLSCSGPVDTASTTSTTTAPTTTSTAATAETAATGPTGITETGTTTPSPYATDCTTTSTPLTTETCLDTPACRVDGLASYAYFGYDMAIGDDFDLDGVADIAVGAPRHSNDGAVFLLSGKKLSQNEESHIGTLEGTAVERFGSSLASEDFNGDGYADLIIGSPEFDGSYELQGRVTLLFGSKNGLDIVNRHTFSAEDEFGQIGTTVSNAGDTDGDGLNEWMTNGGLFDTSGSFYEDGGIWVVSGQTTSWGQENDLTDVATFISGTAGSAAGLALEHADVNMDGYSDLIIGAPYAGNYYGAVYLLFGGKKGVTAKNMADADQTINGASYGDLMGWKLAVGDFNKDALTDLAVSSPTSDQPYGSEGQVDLFTLSSSPPTLLASITGEHDDHQLGTGLTVADLDNDGFDDLLMGAVNAHKNLHTKSGRAYLLKGEKDIVGGNLSEMKLTNIYGANVNDYIGSVMGVADINGDNSADLIISTGYTDSNDTIDSGTLYFLFGGTH
jgi:hypothetical protein